MLDRPIVVAWALLLFLWPVANGQVICPAGQYSSSNVCVSCPVGTYSTSIGLQFVGGCLPCSTCNSFQYVLLSCNASQDTICDTCSDSKIDRLIVCDSNNNKIRRIRLNGTVETIAGNGSAGLANGIGTESTFTAPNQVLLNKNGTTLYVRSSFSIRTVSLTDADGLYRVSTLVGAGSFYTDGSFVNARFRSINCMSFSNDETSMYLTDGGTTRRVRRVDMINRTVSTVAGSGATTPSCPSVGFPAMNISFNTPYGILALQKSPVLIVGDTVLSALFVISLENSTLISMIGQCNTLSFANGVGTNARFNQPREIYTNSNEDALFVNDITNTILRKITYPGLEVSTLAGIQGSNLFRDGVIPTTGSFTNQIFSFSVSANGSFFYIADGNRIRTLDLSVTPSNITTIINVAGTAGGQDGPFSVATFSAARGIEQLSCPAPPTNWIPATTPISSSNQPVVNRPSQIQWGNVLHSSLEGPFRSYINVGAKTVPYVTPFLTNVEDVDLWINNQTDPRRLTYDRFFDLIAVSLCSKYTLAINCTKTALDSLLVWSMNYQHSGNPETENYMVPWILCYDLLRPMLYDQGLMNNITFMDNFTLQFATTGDRYNYSVYPDKTMTYRLYIRALVAVTLSNTDLIESTRLLIENHATQNLFDNGQSWDFVAHDTLDYHTQNIMRWSLIAGRAPSLVSRSVRLLIEKNANFMRQFMVPPVTPHLEYENLTINDPLSAYRKTLRRIWDPASGHSAMRWADSIFPSVFNWTSPIINRSNTRSSLVPQGALKIYFDQYTKMFSDENLALLAQTPVWRPSQLVWGNLTAFSIGSTLNY